MDQLPPFFLNLRRKERPTLNALGRHWLTEFYGCDPTILDDVEQIRKEMEEAARRSGATIVNAGFHLSNTYGVSGVVMIAESHLAIHTRPEFGYAAVDLFTFGEEIDPRQAHDYLKERLKARSTLTTELKRGDRDILGTDATDMAFAVCGKDPVCTAPLIKTPTRYFLASGASEGYTRLNAFDGALLKAGVGNTNLVKMSSIVPPRCQQVAPVALPPGALVPVAYASITSEIPGETISAAIAVALPRDLDRNGLIMEYSAKGPKEEIEETVRQMAIEGMKVRGWEIRDLQSVGSEHTVKKVGTAFAALVLWH